MQLGNLNCRTVVVAKQEIVACGAGTAMTAPLRLTPPPQRESD